MLSNQNFLTLDRLEPHIKVPVRYSKKAKRIAIKINHLGVELILPNKNLNAGHKFLLEKECWIRKKIQSFPKQDYIDQMTIPIFDVAYSLQNIEAEKNKIQINQNIIEVYSKSKQYNYLLIIFLKNMLLVEINKLVIIFSEKHGLNFTKIQLMNNKTKWGSCSSRGVLSFNWRLIFAPKDVLEYLIAHEMSHLVEMNHSKNFWNLVEKIYPNYKTAKLWLKQNGYKLSQYLRPLFRFT